MSNKYIVRDSILTNNILYRYIMFYYHCLIVVNYFKVIRVDEYYIIFIFMINF